MPLPDCDVLMGMPWHFDHKAITITYEKNVTITHRGKTKELQVSTKGEFVSVVSASAISLGMKHHLSAYLVFVKNKEHVAKANNLSQLEKEQSDSLFQFRDCFSDAFPD